MTDNGDALGGDKKELDDKVIPEDAFISTDEPLRRARGRREEASSG